MFADADIAALPKETLHRIDHAFDRAVTEFSSEVSEGPPHKRQRKFQEQSSSKLPDDRLQENDTGGGFLLEDSDSQVIRQSEHKDVELDMDMLIPFSAIPRALQILELPPDDSEILNVLSNAASGWHAGSNQVNNSESFVTRRDWRAVCAVLLAPIQGEDDQVHLEDQRRTSIDGSALSSLSSESEGAYDDESSEDEYVPDKDIGKNKSNTLYKKSIHKQKRSITSREIGSPGADRELSIMESQRRNALDAFSLFFSAASSDSDNTKTTELKDRVLNSEHLMKAAQILKERISPDEVN